MTLSALANSDMEFFAQNGYLVVGNVSDQETEIKPMVAEYLNLPTRLAAGREGTRP